MSPLGSEACPKATRVLGCLYLLHRGPHTAHLDLTASVPDQCEDIYSLRYLKILFNSILFI